MKAIIFERTRAPRPGESETGSRAATPFLYPQTILVAAFAGTKGLPGVGIRHRFVFNATGTRKRRIQRYHHKLAVTGEEQN